MPAVVAPRSLRDAVELLSQNSNATIMGGGTDLMIAINQGHLRPRSVIVIAMVDELRDWRRDGDLLCLGASMTVAELSSGTLLDHAPALVQAARTIGPPQVQNAATVGGNLGTAPRGDLVSVLLALDAAVELICADSAHDRGAVPGSSRMVSLAELMDADGRLRLQPAELIAYVWVPILDGRQEFLTLGGGGVTVTVAVDDRSETVRCAVAVDDLPPIRASLAEHWASTRIDWGSNRLTDGHSAAEFGGRVAELIPYGATTWQLAAYRRHAVSVCARRALERVTA